MERKREPRGKKPPKAELPAVAPFEEISDALPHDAAPTR